MLDCIFLGSMPRLLNQALYFKWISPLFLRYVKIREQRVSCEDLAMLVSLSSVGAWTGDFVPLHSCERWQIIGPDSPASTLGLISQHLDGLEP